MVTVTVRTPDGEEFTYMVNRADHDIVGGDPDGDLVAVLVDAALDSDQFIGPQVDEFVGAWGNWDDPIHVVAAFHDAAAATGSQVLSWGYDDTDTVESQE